MERFLIRSKHKIQLYIIIKSYTQNDSEKLRKKNKEQKSTSCSVNTKVEIKGKKTLNITESLLLRSENLQ